ncbi:MAG TPA: aminotransferase class I/II-fold pyridoxal phosphate-dependent enzyme [Blastocatellia bacterium]|nr:aminotransferase class I/II-fold pyridoxal phosphate-dependent enzyme [Blastocatellia bacterium]
MLQNLATRRRFMGGVATALSFVGFNPSLKLFAQTRQGRQGAEAAENAPLTPAEYDSMAKLANNENGWGPSDTVTKAMTDALKYSNRYRYPDGGIVDAIAAHHGVKPENVIIGAGSGEILKVVNDVFLLEHKRIVGVDPSYDSVFRYATNTKADAIKVPLLKDYRMDIPGIIRATKMNYRDVGFVYICNPNNPTGNIIPKHEIKLLLDSLPPDVVVLIDEAYHHFVTSPDYATSVPYVLEGRPVIVTRTFSKIAALAGMRLGYGLAPKELIERMRPFGGGGLNAIVKYGGVAALKDTAYENKIRQMVIALRNGTTKGLAEWGYEVIPSEANFFMVNVGRDVTPVIEDFRKRKVLVGRKFPPMNNWLRVSVGTEPEMTRFMAAFKELFPAGGIKTKAETSN